MHFPTFKFTMQNICGSDEFFQMGCSAHPNTLTENLWLDLYTESHIQSRNWAKTDCRTFEDYSKCYSRTFLVHNMYALRL